MQSVGPFGPWKPVERIGVGAFGVTWRCRHASDPGREAAVKVLRGEHADVEAYLERFSAERDLLRTLGRTPHANLASYEGSDPEDGAPLWIALAYIPGDDLATCLHDEAMPDGSRLGTSPPDRYHLARVVGIAVAAATAHAHARGIAHRDIKPANIRLTPAGGVVVVDFGIGRDARVDRLTSAEQQSPHTVTYAAPEILRGDLVEDAWLGRLDVYSLGVVLYRILAGNVPPVPLLNDTRGRTHPAPRQQPLTLPSVYPARLIALVQQLTNPDATLRPDMASTLAQLQRLPERPDDIQVDGWKTAPPPTKPAHQTSPTWAPGPGGQLDLQPTVTLNTDEVVRDTVPEQTAAEWGDIVKPLPKNQLARESPAHIDPPARPTTHDDGGGPPLALATFGVVVFLGLLWALFPATEAPRERPAGTPVPNAFDQARAEAASTPEPTATPAPKTPKRPVAPTFPPKDDRALQRYVQQADRARYDAWLAHISANPGWLASFSPSAVQGAVRAGMKRFGRDAHPPGGTRDVLPALGTLGGGLSCSDVRGWMQWTYGGRTAIPAGDAFFGKWCRICTERNPPLDLGAHACGSVPGYGFRDGTCKHVEHEWFGTCP
jgi:serine/threonine protein kinase